MFNFWKKIICFAFAPMHFGGGGGGGGSSSSSTTTQTQNVDKRLVTGQGSMGVSADNSSVFMQVLDGGAVAKSIDFAASVDANAGRNLTTLVGLAKSLDASSAGNLRATLDSNNSNTARTLDSNNSNTARTLDTVRSVFSQSMNILDSAGKMVAKAYDGNQQVIATAYDQAKGQGADARTLAYGALAVVAIVGVMAFRGRG